MFAVCSSLKELNLNNFNTNNVTDMSSMFHGCSSLNELNLNNFNTNNVIYMNANEMYYHIYFNDNKEEIKRNYLNENDNVSKIKIIIDYQVKSFMYLFEDCKCIEYICFIFVHH